MNVFNDEYVKEEISFMALPDTGAEISGVKVTYRNLPTGSGNPDYLSIQFRVDELPIPVYTMDKQLWMSLTPMEVQSAAVAIQRAGGDVACGGLGMGYAPLRMAESDDVDRVTVYEQEARCMELFRQLHGGRETFGKFHFVEGNIRETFVGKSHDFVFMDIYPSLASDDIAGDIAYFIEHNDIGEYRYWGQELALWVSGGYGAIAGEYVDELRAHNILTWQDSMLFSEFTNTEGVDLPPPVTDGEWADSCLYTHLAAMGAEV